ncbi:hypothetical protein RchiOBHm_Chr3g0487051 [Rosa chinensis]|uniref:Uncharacterized protein n=1 Tax=Rosa chinensis TaxID=74649 RepID=A0A2P6RFE5_ROSCH|nr:hypothetical protein RchiOBHm_Chr3g0487051 [Rosa chinensis]
MVAFAGHKYAARSTVAFVANSTYTVSIFICLHNRDCAIKTNSCKTHGGTVDCSLRIQLAFSCTDKHLSFLNSWYEAQNLGQYSLYGLYSNLKDSH